MQNGFWFKQVFFYTNFKAIKIKDDEKNLNNFVTTLYSSHNINNYVIG